MNPIIRKSLLPAVALSFMFVIPAGAVEPFQSSSGQTQALPGEMAFQIPMNNYCSSENSLDFSFQLSNAADTEANITLHLYQKDGSEFKEEGSSYVEIESTLLPGVPQTLPAHATGLYHINFGNGKKCSERVYLGRIVANSGQVSLLARGWVTKRDGMQVTGMEAITVNDNKTFELAGSPQAN